MLLLSNVTLFTLAFEGKSIERQIEISFEEKISFQFAYLNLCFSAIDFNVEKLLKLK
jgi:hypothetical protein